MKESTIAKVFALIQQKEALSKKIGKLLNGNGIEKKPPRIIAVERPSKPNRQRQLQGRYMGSVRNLTKTQKKQVAKIREAKGYIKAIAKAKALARA